MGVLPAKMPLAGAGMEGGWIRTFIMSLYVLMSKETLRFNQVFVRYSLFLFDLFCFLSIFVSGVEQKQR